MGWGPQFESELILLGGYARGHFDHFLGGGDMNGGENQLVEDSINLALLA